MIRYVLSDLKVFAVKNADKADAQKLGAAIEKIAARNNGEVDPKLLWKEAQGNPRHPAYKHYEWDIQKAAESHWTDTSRRIIRAIVPLDDEGEAMAIPAFVSINSGGGTSYRSSQAVMDSAELRAIVLEQAEKDMVSFQLRYRRFQELFDAIEVPIQVVRKLRGKPKGKSKDDRPQA